MDMDKVELTETDRLQSLAQGYAWGWFDAQAGSVASGSTADGVKFGRAYREHVERGKGSRWSVQRAFEAWQNNKPLP